VFSLPDPQIVLPDGTALIFISVAGRQPGGVIYDTYLVG
jgi:hypothetical protein